MADCLPNGDGLIHRAVQSSLTFAYARLQLFIALAWRGAAARGARTAYQLFASGLP
ncbi:UNVERIFIED_ORG: hypothetical protein ABIC62_002706 [Burkholderia sp. 1595]|uniref:Uncharacterized protein n=1 Tax=Paraburkholderia terricola TaxID=169427 RepID=A0ABU1LTM0_9BURK|nr:hypothetical protein [Paraburkholderia terricola]